MSGRLDIPSIKLVVEALEQCHPSRKLVALQHIANHNGGRLDVPSVNGQYVPLISSIELFGVYAMAEDVEDLPKNWIKAATNILQADEPAIS
ncbi:hypothetical protein LCM27_01955 [Ruegeria marisrubri]|uniref:hypothetical protein n=1 Tax=Ruegeria marisrubri TaxID=1685379 RepID=UPI001CD69748|nr:hypothetical protein [Ruegeria marisrubri]MCA0905156.1 hypothetical protein [Ruegeria marisrubri]